MMSQAPKPEIEKNEIEPAKTSETEDSENVKKPVFRSLKSRTTWLIITFFVALILLLMSIPGFFDKTELKFKIEQKSSQILDSNFSINGNVDVALFPIPSITLHDVLLKNYKKEGKIYNLHAKAVTIRLSLIKFLSKEFSIDRLTFTQATLETYFEANISTARHNKFGDIDREFTQKAAPQNPQTEPTSKTILELFSVEKFQATQFSEKSLPTIEIRNGMIISYDKSSRKKEIEDINSKIAIDAKKIRGSGKFTNNKTSTSFKLSANFNSDASKKNSTLEINSASINITLKGSFTGENKGIFNSDFEGKAEAEIFEIRTFYKDFVSNNSAIYDKIKPNSQSIKISSDIKNAGGEITLENIILNSALIDGKGSATIDFTHDLPCYDVTLDLENLDLDNIWSKERVSTKISKPNYDLEDGSKETVESLVKHLLEEATKNEAKNAADLKAKTAQTDKKPEELSLKIAKKIKNFNLSAEIKIKNVTYFEGVIKDMNLYLTISKDGQIMVLPMIFNIPGDGKVRINGVLENKADLPKFIGKIDVVGNNLGETLKWLQLQSPNLKFDNLKEYATYSDVMLVPNIISLNNFYLSLNNQSEFLGEIKIDSSGKVTNITNKFQVSTFNVDDFFLTSVQNIYLSQGSLLRKMLWLNDIPSSSNLVLTFDKLIYKNEEFFGPSSLKLQFGQGYFKVTELKLTSDKTKLQANLEVDIRTQFPTFSLNIMADNLHYDTRKLVENKDAKPAKIPNFVDQFYALPSLEGFSGDISLVVQNIALDALEIKNSKLSAKLKDGNIPDADISCDIYNSAFKYKGLIGLKNDKIINGNITFNKVPLEKILPDLVGISGVSGVSNVSANITSVAGSRVDFFKTLDSNIKFSAASLVVQGYGLSDLVHKMFYPTSFIVDLQNPEKILANPSAKTFFKQASGTISIEKDKSSKFSINLVATAVNGILSGKFSLSANTIDALTNIIFVTGSRQKQIPLNIATALKGNLNSISSSSNLNQIRQYLRLPLLNKPADAPAPASTVAPASQSLDKSTLINPTTPQEPASNGGTEADVLKAQENASKQQVMEQLNAITQMPAIAPPQAQ